MNRGEGASFAQAIQLGAQRVALAGLLGERSSDLLPPFHDDALGTMSWDEEDRGW